MYPELATVEGYLVFTEPDGTDRRLEHTWNETPDCEVVDSTAWAFGQALPYRYEPDPGAWAAPRPRSRTCEVPHERRLAPKAGSPERRASLRPAAE